MACGGRPSAACTLALGRITLHAASSSRRLAARKINFSSQGSALHTMGRAACRRQAAARVAAAAAAGEGEAAAAASKADAAATKAEVKFHTNLSALHAFVAQHGRQPLQRENFEGIPLGQWVSTQRQKRGTLRPEQVAALEAVPGWSWNPREERWSSDLSILNVRSDHGCDHAPVGSPSGWRACMHAGSVVWLPM